MTDQPSRNATIQRLREKFILSNEDVYALVEEFMSDPTTDEWDPDHFSEWFRDEIMGQFEPSEKRLRYIMKAKGWTFDA